MDTRFRGLGNSSPNRALNFEKRKLRIASLKSLPFQDVKEINESYFAGEGFSFEIVKQLSQHFNFTYDILVPQDQDFGMLINGSSWTGLVGMLLNNEADMVAAPLSITQERQNVVTFSSSLFKDSLGLIFTRPEGRQNNEALLAPFTDTVWISVVTVALTMCPLLYVLVYASNCFLLKDSMVPSAKNTLNLSDCSWFVFSSLMKQGFSKTTAFNPVRMLMAAWWLTCLIIAAFYTANLTAYMTTETSVMDHAIEQFILSGKKWMFRKGTAFSDSLFKERVTDDENEFSLLKRSFINGNGIMINTEEDVIDFVRKGYAYIQEVTVLNYMLFKDYMDTSGYCHFSVLDLHFFEHTSAFAFPKGSPYASSFSEYIEFLRKTGLVQKWMQQHLLSADVCAFHFDNKLSRNQQALSIYEFHTAFYILCIGAISGLLWLLMELRKSILLWLAGAWLLIKLRYRLNKKILYKYWRSRKRFKKRKKLSKIITIKRY